MTIADSLQNVTLLFLDTAPVVYFVERNPQYFETVRVVFDRLTELRAVVLDEI